MALSKPMEIVTAATAAGVGGALATAILYPLDTLKTRMQSRATPLEEEQPQSLDSNAPHASLLRLSDLYRGLQVKTAQSATSKFLYFCVYTLLTQVASSKRIGDVDGDADFDKPPIGTLVSLVLGYLSELLHLPVTIPMEVIGTRLQTSSGAPTLPTKQHENQVAMAATRSSRIGEIVRTIRAEHGGSLCGLYKGLHAYFVLCLQPAIQYTAFEKLKIVYLQHSKQVSLSALEAFVLGAVARSLATLLLYPYIRAKVLLQAAASRQSSPVLIEANDPTEETAPDAKPKEGIMSTIRRVWRDEGVLALYRGLAPELTRGALSAALMLMIKEKIQTYVTMAFILMSSMRKS